MYWLLDVAILQLLQSLEIGGARARTDLGIAGLARAQLPGEERRQDDQERQREQTEQRHREEVGELSELPAERRRLGRRQREAAGADFGRDVAEELGANALRLAGRDEGSARHARRERALQGAFLADLADAAPDPVDEARRRALVVRAHPGEHVGAGGEACAVTEDPRQPGARALRQVGERVVRRSVAVADECEIRRQAWRLDAVRPQVDLERIVEHDEPGEVQPREGAERHDRIARVGHSGRCVHRAQQCAQVRLAAGRDRRDHHEVVLRRHAQNWRQKSIRRSLAQYTLPR